jgi:hypothetical protein
MRRRLASLADGKRVHVLPKTQNARALKMGGDRLLTIALLECDIQIIQWSDCNQAKDGEPP